MRDVLPANRGCAKCNYRGVLAGKLGGKWTYYPQIPCECQQQDATSRTLPQEPNQTGAPE